MSIKYHDLNVGVTLGREEGGIQIVETEDPGGGTIVTVTGNAGGFTVTETEDPGGGTIVAITGQEIILQGKNATPSSSQQVISPDSGYTGLSSVTIAAVPSEYIIPTGTKSITANGTDIDVSEYAKVDVAVPTSSPNLQDKTTTPTTSQQVIEADSSYDGLSSVTVNSIPSQYIVPSGTKSITANGTGIDVASYASVDVSVIAPTPVINLQAKTNISPTESSQTINYDNGYDGLSSVQINAISSTYVGSEVTRRDSTDLTELSGTISVPSGYYASDISKAVSSGSATTPTTTISVTPSISVSSAGLITVSASGSKSITPTVSAGYVSSGTAGTVSVSGSNTLQLSVQAGTTITPTNSEQTAVASGKYTTGAVKVAAIPSGTAGTPTATKGTVSNHSITVTPSVTNTAGYISGGTKTGTAVTVNVSELESGTKSITANGTGISVSGYSTVDVAVPVGTSKNTQINAAAGRATSSTYTNTNVSLTVSTTGTYHVYWSGYRSSTSGTNGSQLYINGSAYGNAQTSFNSGSGLTNTQQVHLSGVSLSKDDVITVYARSRGNNYYMYVMNLIIIQA